MTAPPGSGADLDEQVAAIRRRRLSRFAPDTLLWLAALPEWTEPLAAAAGFPPPPEETRLAPLLDRLEAAGLLARRADVGADGRTVTAFWLPGSHRAEVGELLRATASTSELTDRVRTLAATLRRLPPTHSTQLDPWFRVVDRLADVSGGALLRAVDELVEHDQTTEALSVVGSARVLADLLGEPLGSAARRARWRIDRAYREALDARSLSYYLSRPDLEAAIERLLRGDGSIWALHLLGDGGIGKTMAIRDLCSGRFAARAGMAPFPVARIDFDHLDPRYPEDRPGELLVAFAGELVPFTTTREAEYRYRRLDDTVARVHEAMADPGTGDVTALLDDAVEAFARYVLAFAGLVVLVLDTCEELAKLHPPGGRSAAVDQTFAMLERIHDRAPAVRVVLAGRRWLVPPPDGGGADDLVLEPRTYLQVEPLGGFDPGQARAYLDLRDPSRTVPPPLRAAIVDRSSKGRPDVNPFEMAGYCDWALADPDLDAEQLRTAIGDPYVEQRIIARLPSSAVRGSLAAAVELGRFDRSLIEPELRRHGIDVDAAFSGLAGQEWVSAVKFDKAGRPHIVEIDDQLRPRLRTVLAAHPQQFPLDRARLGADMAAHLRAAPLDEAAITALETAIRLLPVLELGVLWDKLERRIVDTPAAWSWAEQATARAGAAELARAGGDGPTVLAAIRATQAAAVARRRGQPGRAGLWVEVAQNAGRHPDPDTGFRLAFRALCARAGAGDPAAAELLSRAWPGRPAEADESAIAAFEELAGGPAAVPTALRPALEELCGSGTVEIGVPALLIRAMGTLADGDLDGTAADVERALSLTEIAPVGAHRWAHWMPPPGLVHRARLARIVLAMTRGEPLIPLPLDRWRSAALSHTADIDAERLVAATLTAQLWWHPVDRAVVEEAGLAERYDPLRRPTSPWHAAVPSLHETLARATAAAGEPVAAAAALRARREDAIADGEDPVTVADCDSALITLCRQFRTTSFTKSVHRAARGGADRDRLDAWATLALINGESPGTPAEAGDWTTWLRTQIVRSGLIAAHPPPPDAAPVDRLEYALCRGDDIRALAARDPTLMDALARAATTRSALRAAALCRWPIGTNSVIHGHPPRILAETALAEGELLGLRLPAPAFELLRLAVDRATAAGDLFLAGRAATLRALCAARAGLDAGAMAAADRAAITALRHSPSDAWAERAAVADRLLDGGPAPRVGPSSPELHIGPRQDTGWASATAVPPAPDWGSAPAGAPVAAAGSVPRRAPSVQGGYDAQPGYGRHAGYGSPPQSPPRPPAPGPTHSGQQAGYGSPPPTPARPRRRWLPWFAAATATATAGLVLSVVLIRPAGNEDPTPAAPADTTTTAPGTLPPPDTSRLTSPAPTAATTAAPTTEGPTTSPTVAPAPTASTGTTVLGIVVSVLVLAGLIGLLAWTRRHVASSWAHLRRPRMDQPVVAFTGSGERLECRLRTTVSGLVLTVAGSAAQRQAATDRPVVVLFAQRRGSIGAPSEILRSGGVPPSALAVRFRQSKPPITWHLWPEQAPRGTTIASEYRGPLHLAPHGSAAEPAGSVRSGHPVMAVQHLVGVPVPTSSAGWRLRIAAGAPAQDEYTKQSRSTYLGDELVGPDDLDVDWTALVVLQAEPVDGPPRRLDEQYEGMCALAADLRDAGAGAVLTVPPLPDTVAADVVAACRSAMTRHARRVHPVHVVDLALDIRTRVAAAGSAAAADDVLLFANARSVMTR